MPKPGSRKRTVAKVNKSGTNIPTIQKQHSAKCKLCKHPERKAIEESYLGGDSAYDIEIEYPGIDHACVYAHVKMFGLDDKRDNSSLTKIRKLLERAGTKRIKLTEGSVVKLIELQAKITGELIERHKSDTKMTLDLTEAVQRRIDRVLAAVPGLKDRGGG
jgi:hypothetical protein